MLRDNLSVLSDRLSREVANYVTPQKSEDLVHSGVSLVSHNV